MGHRRSYRDSYYGRDREPRDSYRDREYRGGGGGGGGRGGDRDRDRDPYGRDNRDWRDRRSPPPRRYSPDYNRRRRSYSRSPPRGSSPARAREYDAPSSAAAGSGEPPRW